MPRIVALRDNLSSRPEMAELVGAVNAFLDLLTTSRGTQKAQAEWIAGIDGLFGSGRSEADRRLQATRCLPRWVTDVRRGAWRSLQDDALEPLQASLDEIAAGIAKVQRR